VLIGEVLSIYRKIDIPEVVKVKRLEAVYRINQRRG
jgi:hypothetical protein